MAHTDVAEALQPIFTSKEGRAFRERIGFGPESLVVLCSPDDHVADVLERARASNPPVLVAFLENGELRLIVLAPTHQGESPAQVVSRRVTISMLYHSAQHTGEAVFRIGEWEADQVASILDGEPLFV
jgi:hypothetical protein